MKLAIIIVIGSGVVGMLLDMVFGIKLPALYWLLGAIPGIISGALVILEDK